MCGDGTQRRFSAARAMATRMRLPFRCWGFEAQYSCHSAVDDTSWRVWGPLPTPTMRPFAPSLTPRYVPKQHGIAQPAADGSAVGLPGARTDTDEHGRRARHGWHGLRGLAVLRLPSSVFRPPSAVPRGGCPYGHTECRVLRKPEDEKDLTRPELTTYNQAWLQPFLAVARGSRHWEEAPVPPRAELTARVG